MTEFHGDFDPDDLLRESLERQRLADELDARKEQYREYLASRGVDFDVASSELLDVKINTLASLKNLQDTALAQPHSDEELADIYAIKRQEQAHMLMQGYTGPWLELVDDEFQGEPLDTADPELVAELMAGQAETRQEAEEQFRATATDFDAFLAEHEVRLSGDEMVVLGHLAFIKNTFRKPQDALDFARSTLLQHDMRGDVWQRFLDRFFPVD